MTNLAAKLAGYLARLVCVLYSIIHLGGVLWFFNTMPVLLVAVMTVLAVCELYIGIVPIKLLIDELSIWPYIYACIVGLILSVCYFVYLIVDYHSAGLVGWLSAIEAEVPVIIATGYLLSLARKQLIVNKIS